MGRGDRKTTKGKTAKRSYGNKRLHKLPTTAATKAVAKPSIAKKPIAAPSKPAPRPAAASRPAAAPRPSAAPKKKV